MKVRTKVNIVRYGAFVFFFILLFSSLEYQRGKSDELGLILFGISFFYLVAMAFFFFLEFRVPSEKENIVGPVEEIEIREEVFLGKLIIFKFDGKFAVIGAPTSLVKPPNISINDKVKVFGEFRRSEDFPGYIWWGAKDILKEKTEKVFFVSRLKNLNTNDEYESPFLIFSLLTLLWMLLSIIIFILLMVVLLPDSIVEKIHYPMGNFIFVSISLFFLAIIFLLPNWIIEKRKAKERATRD